MRRSKWEDQVPGGLADKRKPSDFDPAALTKGHKVEMEHTTDPLLAREIAMDHLTEDPNYYDKLEQMEKEAWVTRVDKLAAAFLTRQAVSGDPYWIKAKYPGKAMDGTPVKKGDRVLYWPRTRSMMVGPKADRAWREFESQVEDEDFYNRRAGVRQAEIVSPSPVIVGDIFYSSWGYDQTNVDFYQVTKTSSAMISIRQIDKKILRGHGKPTEWVIPVANQFRGPVMSKKLMAYQGRAMVKLNSYSSAYKWDGQEKGQTGGGFGH